MFMKNLQAVMAGMVVLAWAGFAFGAPPVPGPVEGFIISTSTDIECIGTVKESSSYNTTSYAGSGPLTPAAGGAFNSGAEVAYQSSFIALDGTTRFVKDFQADSSTAPNLTVNTIIGFKANTNTRAVAGSNSNASLAIFEEKAGLSVVSAGEDGLNFAGLLSLCPWATGYSSGASNTGVAAGSRFKVTSIENFSTRAEVTSTDVPLLVYGVDAVNRQGGVAGVGEIAASMVIEISQSDAHWAGGAAPPPLQSRTSFSEFASANGVWNFSKQMRYGGVVTGHGTVNPFAQLP